MSVFFHLHWWHLSVMSIFLKGKGTTNTFFKVSTSVVIELYIELFFFWLLRRHVFAICIWLESVYFFIFSLTWQLRGRGG